MINVLLSGCFGKMCVTVAGVIAGKEDMQVISGVDMCRDMTASFPTYTNFSEVLETPDVIIDFSDPSNLTDLLAFAQKNNVPAVIATTGYTAEQIEEIKAASKNIPIFFTFNMSLGVNVLVLLAKSAAKILGDDFDIEIIEKHHNQKIDAPSGTAIMLANAVNSVFEDKKEYEYDRHIKREKRKKSEIGMHSVRGGTIVGEHDVIFAGNDEVITLSHTAQSKALFATGAVKAAAFLAGKPAGMYDMQMMLDM
ncbi:MAG: 4-hydroxy-tetrahydrodipicolinate reductase [Ruminococcaceae bacterium]|nr:4-hydroxy-tetrahydrodipicolinate reductase [Oscillospiraceae bacterium]